MGTLFRQVWNFRLECLLLITLCILGIHSSNAQTNFPDRPIRLVVGYPPGGAADFVARVTADQLSKELGVSVVVENKPGAGGAIAADLTAKSSPDGYTISMSGPHAQIRALYPKMALDVEKDFIPISNLATGAMIICTNPQAPYKNLKELIQFAKANPDKIEWNVLSDNPNAIDLLKANPDKINWHSLSKNASIFYDTYQPVAKEYFRKEITEELMMRMFHPKNINKFSTWGFEAYE